MPEPEWLNRTINIDTGCVFGGKLTALRYPEKELVSVPARTDLRRAGAAVSADAELRPALTAQQANDDLLDIEDVLGKRIVTTRLHRNVTIREENATAALEVMSRFAANPKWLIYLPPTMSPCETSKRDGLLEHPAEAFAYFRINGVPTGRSAKRSTWGRARWSSSAATRMRHASASACSERGRHRATRAPAGASSTTSRWSASFWRRVRAALDAADSGTSRTPTGSASTAN